MKKVGSSAASALLLGLALLNLGADAKACVAALPSTSDMVARANVIVRASAIRYVKTPTENLVELDFSSDGNVEFKIEEILKGENIPPTLLIEGRLSDKDDLNNRPVPYDSVRPGGQAPCYAFAYKRGTEFLLFLKAEDGELTPYWYALAPVNEQLRSADDPWVVWVRGQLRRRS